MTGPPLDPAAFFAAQRGALVAASRSGGGAAVVGWIRGFSDPRQRIILYTLARQALAMGRPHERDLDAAIAVADAGLAEVAVMLSAAEAGQAAADLRRTIHVLNFNLAADLADCWPEERGKPSARLEGRHFVRGLQAARVLVGEMFAGTLEPRIIANDYWVLGMHQLSLGDVEGACASWERASRLAREAADAAGRDTEPGPGASFQVNLFAGYLAIGRWLSAKGLAAPAKAYREAVGAFRAQAEAPETAEDARFGLAQLEIVRARYAAGLV